MHHIDKNYIYEDKEVGYLADHCTILLFWIEDQISKRTYRYTYILMYITRIRCAFVYIYMMVLQGCCVLESELHKQINACSLRNYSFDIYIYTYAYMHARNKFKKYFVLNQRKACVSYFY